MSIPANILEGSASPTGREFSRFLGIALKSSTELEYHLIAARDFGLVRDAESVTLITQVIEVRKMLYGLIRHLATRSADRSSPAREMTPD